MNLSVLSGQITVPKDQLKKIKNGEIGVKFSKPEEPGTEQQNRFAHALLSAYYKTGQHSAPERYTQAEFKIYMKVQYGPCYEMDIDGNIIKVPKSWADYNKFERMAFIDGLLSEIYQVVCPLTPELEEIIQGAEI